MTPSDPQFHVTARRQAEMRQYSRTVNWMKIVLPVGAIALILTIFLTGEDRGAVIDMQSTANVAALGAGLKLENPRFAGQTDAGDPFIVTARSALPDGAVPDRIELDQPSGEVRLSDGIRLVVTALAGEMFRKDEELHLNGSVQLETSNGYTAQTDRVELDLANKTAVAPGMVQAEGPLGGIRADRLSVVRKTPEAKDVTVRFEGNVKVTYIPQDEAAADLTTKAAVVE